MVDVMSDQSPDTPSWAVPPPSTAGADQGPVGSTSASSSPDSIPSGPAGAAPSLDAPPDADPPGGQLPRPRLSRSRVIAGGVALVAALGLGGFLAGTALADGRGDGQTGRTASGPRGGARGDGHGGDPNQPGRGEGLLPGGAPGGGRGQGPGRFDDSRMTAGVITSVADGRLVLRARNGASVTVVTTAKTVVRGPSATTVSALKVGEVVFVQGARAADGSYTAEQILAGIPRGGHGDGDGDGPGFDDHDGGVPGSGSGSAPGSGSGTAPGGGTTTSGATT